MSIEGAGARFSASSSAMAALMRLWISASSCPSAVTATGSSFVPAGRPSSQALHADRTDCSACSRCCTTFWSARSLSSSASRTRGLSSARWTLPNRLARRSSMPRWMASARSLRASTAWSSASSFASTCWGRRPSAGRRTYASACEPRNHRGARRRPATRQRTVLHPCVPPPWPIDLRINWCQKGGGCVSMPISKNPKMVTPPLVGLLKSACVAEQEFS